MAALSMRFREITSQKVATQEDLFGSTLLDSSKIGQGHSYKVNDGDNLCIDTRSGAPCYISVNELYTPGTFEQLGSEFCTDSFEVFDDCSCWEVIHHF